MRGQRSFLFFVALATQVRAIGQNIRHVVNDGEYVALEPMPNLTPDDRIARWFHENTLLVRNDEAVIDKAPIVMRKNKKEESSADGGFFTYRARFIRKDGQTFVVLRLFQSDYVTFPPGKHDQYTELKTYLVKLFAGKIEFDGVTYTPAVLDKSKSDRLLQFLNIKLEKSNLAP